ncbi:MAG: Uma2 family endonuclease [Chloroflexi bacterium]|nr:Uma2 family endonuclease [Chloroflexota bacterium]
MLRPLKTKFTPAEYLAMEEAAEYKSEYYAGEIFAMAGGTTDHSIVAVNLFIELGNLLSAKSCRLFNSDVRLLVQPSGLYTYPDVMVICGKIEFVERRKDTVTNPILIVEVLSESTRDYDRGAKFNFYKQIPSLQEYVTIESESARVECYRRTGDKWTIETYDNLNAVARFESLACEIPVKRIYHKVSWLE